MNKWSKRFLITGGITLATSIAILASVLGVQHQKKVNNNQPDNLIVENDKKLPVAPISEELDDVTFKANKIHIPKSPTKAFENRELLYVDLEASTPEKITWVKDAKKTYKNIEITQTNNFKESKNNYDGMKAKLEEITKINQNRIVYDKLLDDINWWERSYNELITKGTNNIIWDKKYLQSRLINSDLNSKNQLKEELARYIISLHQYLTIFDKTFNAGNITNIPSINIDGKTINLKKSIAGVLTYKTAAKEFLDYLKSIVITSHNIEDVIWEIDDKMLHLNTMLADVKSIILMHAIYLETIESKELTQFFNPAYENHFLSILHNFGLQGFIFEQKLIQTLQYDIDLYNKNLTNEKFNSEAYLHLLNVKYKKFTDNILALAPDQKVGQEALSVFNEFKENQAKIDKIDQKYIKNKVIDQIINLRYFASTMSSKIESLVQDAKERYYKFAGNDFAQFYKYINENNDKYYEYIKESVPIESTLKLLKNRRQTIDKYLENLIELRANTAHLASEVPNISLNLNAKIDQYKGYSSRLKSMIDENETILKNVPNSDIDSQISFDQTNMDVLMFDDDEGANFPAHSRDKNIDEITKLLRKIVSLDNNAIRELVTDWKSTCSVSDTDVDYIFQAYESGLKNSQREFIEFLKNAFNNITQNIETINAEIKTQKEASEKLKSTGYDAERLKLSKELEPLAKELKNAIQNMPKTINSKNIDPATAQKLVEGYKILLEFTAFKPNQYIESYWELNSGSILIDELKNYLNGLENTKNLISDLMYSLIKKI
ncbi:hypothetical protein [Mycoplasma sp. Sp33II]|uniref:hypothetical protein n=1 Tax=unclassified Mycoplasma TaxID=2683645 RepID=UPI003AAA7620